MVERDSVIAWALVRFFVIVFRYTPGFYVAGIVALVLANGLDAWRLITTRILGGLLAAEAVYYATIWRPFHARLNLPAEHPELWPATRPERRELFNECFAHVANPGTYLQWWFLGSDRRDIRRDNVREFILWGFFDREHLDPTSSPEDAELLDEIDEYISIFENKLGRTLAPGRGPAKSLRLTLDHIETAYRSLPWYGVVFMVDQLTHLAMTLMGFQYHPPAGPAPVFPPRPQTVLARHQSPASNLGYWFKPHNAGADALPVVFFHGIGVGLWTYLRFIFGIVRSDVGGNSGTLGVIAVEMLPISFRLTSPIPGQSEFVRQVTKILDHHDWDQVSVVSHSYGSVPTTHIIRSPELEHRVVSTVLLDPVTILLHLPWVAYNFTRRAPKTTNEWIMWYFASMDPGVAHCLGRHFFWRHNAIFKRELTAPVPIRDRGASDRDNSDDGHVLVRPRRVAVCLSGRDLIVETGAVEQYLTQRAEPKVDQPTASSPVEVLVFPELDHAQVFATADGTRRVVNLVKNYCVI